VCETAVAARRTLVVAGKRRAVGIRLPSVHAGRQFIPASIRRLITEDPPVPELSPRQLEILSSITRGLSNDDIAKQLGISRASVKTHILALFQKLGAATRAEAVAIALRKHLLKI